MKGRRLRRIALVLGTLVFMALSLEVGTRLFADVLPPIVRIDPVAGLQYIPSFQGDLYNPESKLLVPIRFNRDGFRGRDLPHAKPAGVRRVAVLGDSMVAALEVDEDQTFVGRLDLSLGAEWEVINFGVTGTGTAQSLYNYREFVARYDVDVVVCAFFAANDLADNSRRLTNQPRLYFDLDEAGKLVQLPVRVRRSAISRWLHRHSRFYVWFKHARAQAKRRGAPVMDWFPVGWVYCTQPPPDVVHAWSVTEALLETLADEVRAAGARFILVGLPSAEQVDASLFAELSEGKETFEAAYPHRRLGAFCRTHGIEWVPLGEGFQREHYYRGFGHFNETGHELAARALKGVLLR